MEAKFGVVRSGDTAELSVKGQKVKLYHSYKFRHDFSLFGLVLLLASSATNAETGALPDPLQAGWKGNKVCEILHEDTEQRILRCTFPPGAGHERHFHVPHFGYTLAGGRVRITDESGVRELDLTKGNSRFSKGTPWHEVVNIAHTTIVYLIVEKK